jgi:hypothetical protein
MTPKVAPSFCFSLVFVIVACAALAAQGPQISVTQSSGIIQPANGPDPGLVKFTAISDRKTIYDDEISWDITGNDNPQWHRGYLAMPFTPKEDATAKEVLIALGYIGGGSNDGVIAIYTDDGGVPGQALKSWRADDFQREGSCCLLVALRDRDGIPLAAGTQYWIVAAAGPHSQSSYGWSLIWNDTDGKLAFLDGFTHDEWLPYRDNLAAFAVYGTFP